MQQCYQKYAAVLEPQGRWINSTVVEIDPRFHLEGFAWLLVDPNAPAPSAKALKLAREKGRDLGHFGAGSLSFAETIDRHLEFLTSANLTARCPWHYLTQAVGLGQKTTAGAVD